jgi:hypothetical protein
MYKLVVIEYETGKQTEETYFFYLSQLLEVVNPRLRARYEIVPPDTSYLELNPGELTQISNDMYVTRLVITMPRLRVPSHEKSLKHIDLVNSMREIFYHVEIARRYLLPLADPKINNLAIKSVIRTYYDHLIEAVKIQIIFQDYVDWICKE